MIISLFAVGVLRILSLARLNRCLYMYKMVGIHSLYGAIFIQQRYFPFYYPSSVKLHTNVTAPLTKLFQTLHFICFFLATVFSFHDGFDGKEHEPVRVSTAFNKSTLTTPVAFCNLGFLTLLYLFEVVVSSVWVTCLQTTISDKPRYVVFLTLILVFGNPMKLSCLIYYVK